MNEIALTQDELKQKAIQYLEDMGFLKNLDSNQKNTFIEIAQGYGLNPYKREIYAIGYTDRDGKVTMSVVTGYEVYLKRADRISKSNGWKCTVTGTAKIITVTKKMKGSNGYYEKEVQRVDKANSDMVAKCTIWRKDWEKPFEWETDLSEFSGDSPMWAEKTKFMLKKVCMAQAHRLCFPDEMGGMPYTEEENEVTHSDWEEVTPAEKQKQVDEMNIKQIMAEIKPLYDEKIAKRVDGFVDKVSQLITIHKWLGNECPKISACADTDKLMEFLEFLRGERKEPSKPEIVVEPEPDLIKTTLDELADEATTIPTIDDDIAFYHKEINAKYRALETSGNKLYNEYYRPASVKKYTNQAVLSGKIEECKDIELLKVLLAHLIETCEAEGITE